MQMLRTVDRVYKYMATSYASSRSRGPVETSDAYLHRASIYEAMPMSIVLRSTME